MINRSILGFAVIAALGFGLVGCGDSNNAQEEVIDDILGGGEINGCMGTSARDETGSATVTITDISAWEVPHSACIIVSQGTAVTWQGNFDEHPLVGGTSPLMDPGSPVTQAGSTSGTDDATITFSATGVFPYFCDMHATTMLGVVYVVP